MTDRYIQQGEYYIQDTTTKKKISNKNAVKLLNHQERIILDKTELILDLTSTMKAYETNLKSLEKDNEYYKLLLRKLIG